MRVLHAQQFEVLLPIRAFLRQWRRTETNLDPSYRTITTRPSVFHVFEIFVAGDGALAQGSFINGMHESQLLSRLHPCFNEVAHNTAEDTPKLQACCAPVSRDERAFGSKKKITQSAPSRSVLPVSIGRVLAGQPLLLSEPKLLRCAGRRNVSRSARHSENSGRYIPSGRVRIRSRDASLHSVSGDLI